MRPKVFTWPAADRDGIVLAQQLGAAGSLVINGALASNDGRYAPKTGAMVGLMPGIQRVVTLYSTGNLSGIDFTVTGYDASNVPIAETIAGPNNTTVSTTAEFSVVTGISADAAVGTNIEIGTGQTGRTAPYRHNHRLNPANDALFVEITGTMDVDVQYTPEPEAPFVWFDHPTMAGLTASAVGNIAFPPAYISAAVQSGSTGSMVFTITQSG